MSGGRNVHVRRKGVYVRRMRYMDAIMYNLKSNNDHSPCNSDDNSRVNVFGRTLVPPTCIPNALP